MVYGGLSPHAFAIAVSAAPRGLEHGRNRTPSSVWHDRRMPSPIGHALGGLAAGCLVSRRLDWRILSTFAVVGMLPDLDFLFPIQHRGPSHSISAAAVAFLVALAVLEFVWPTRQRVRLAAAIAAAYASHTLLDWLGEDTWSPMGIMALWPFSSAFYVSGLEVFSAVSRRYWTAGFWRGNAIAGIREVMILGPIFWMSWRVARRTEQEARRPVSIDGTRARSSDRAGRRRPSA